VILLQRSLNETPSRKKHQIDYVGTVVFSAAMLLLLNLFLSTGSLGLSRGLFIGLTVVAAVLLLVLFYFIERKANEPMIPSRSSRKQQSLSTSSASSSPSS
jgi:chromate transport protein ChrA